MGNRKKDPPEWDCLDDEQREKIGAWYDADQKKKSPKKKLLTVGLVLVSIPVAVIVYYVVASLLSAVIAFVGSIPFLGSLLYYPSDAGWAQLAIPIPGGIFAAAYCAKKISGTTKFVSCLFAGIFLLDLVYVIITGFSFYLVAKDAMAIVAAIVCFGA